jgi:flagellar hook-basal body complex protein FliE
MPIEGIGGPKLGLPPGIDPQRAGPAGRAPAVGGEGEEGAFASDLATVLRDVSSLQRRSAQATEALVRGEPIDLHEVLIRQDEARIAFSLLIETRNKVLEAYQEIMKMSV